MKQIHMHAKGANCEFFFSLDSLQLRLLSGTVSEECVTIIGGVLGLYGGPEAEKDGYSMNVYSFIYGFSFREFSSR